jgi:DNA repair protein RecN (Recombination protein N)
LLRSLRIENLVLVRDGQLVPGSGLTAITGETGAGKTILTQAVGLLLGAKGDAGVVGAAGTEAYVEAELDLPDGFFEDEELAGPAASSATDARAPTPGAAPSRGRTSQRPQSA